MVSSNMTLAEKVKAVESVFEDLDRDIATFQGNTGIGCIRGCGACCTKPDIEATILEFLPLAYQLHLQGRENEIFDRLASEQDSTICLFFATKIPGHGAGMCTIYEHRGLICRLFGFSATTDKYGKPVLATCKYIKGHENGMYQHAVDAIDKGAFVPVMNNYYMRLLAIDMSLGNQFYPINKAIQLAIEKVGMYFAYESPAS